MKYHFIIKSDENGYIGECLELEGCQSQGDSIDELKQNLKEALDLFIDESPGSNYLFPLPNLNLDNDKNIIEVPVDPKIAFAQLLRQTRLKNKLTQEQAQKRMGLPNRNSYARLERRCNPRLDTIAKLKNAFPDFPLDQCLT